jgi:subtilase family serine protease/RNA polymerase subunit RPABC4/transcription elongation factor Spt4
LINNQAITDDVEIPFLSNDEWKIIELEWEAQLGSYVFKVAVDPDDEIGESDETNNNKTVNLGISTGAPDLFINSDSIIFNPAKGTKEEVVNITVRVGNMGDTDPRSFDNPVYVDLYLGDPDAGGEQIGDTRVINSIKPFEYGDAYFEHTFDLIGDYDIYARVTTDLDSETTNNFAFTTLSVLDFSDLTIKPADIKFKPSDKVAKDTDVTIEVTVANIGESSAYNVEVDFYEGDPDGSSSTHLGTKVAPVVEGRVGLGSAMVTFTQPFSVQGLHNIFVVIDGQNNTRELDEDNNKANSTFRVLKGPDLLIKEDYIMILSSMEGHIVQDETVTITTQVDNIGETASGPFLVNFYYRNDLNLIGSVEVENLEPGDDTSVQVSWSPTDVGLNKIIARAIPTTPIIEMDVENNANSTWFRIYSKADLTMDPEDLFSDINLIPPSVPYSKDVKLTATIRNRGESDAREFWVQFFDGNPATGGTQIGLNKRVTGLAAGKSTSVEVTWSALPGGPHTIYCKIDPFNEVVEANEANNTRTLGIYVETVPDLVVKTDDILFLEGEFGRIGSPLTVNVTIWNTGDIDSDAFTVNIYDGDKVHDKTFTLIESIDHDGIEGGESDTVEVTWTPDSFGNHKIFVWIDEDEEIFELNDENNYAFKVFEVLEIAPDLVFDEKTDLRITEDGLQATNYKTYIAYELNITIDNQGNEAVKEFYVSIVWTDPTGKMGMLSGDHIMVSGLASGASTNVVEIWKPTVVGAWKFDIMVDSTELYREFNEDNNSNAEPIQFNVLQLPDFFIENPTFDITVIPLDARVGDELTIIVDVKATGHLDIEEAIMSLTVDGTPVGAPQSQAMTLDGNLWTATFTYTYTPEQVGIPKFVFTLDPDKTVKELNEGNNEATWENLYITEAEEEEEPGLLEGMVLWIIIIAVIVVVVIVLLLFFLKKRKKEPIECESCGALVEPGVTPCPECGAEIKEPPELVECKNCGAEITTEDKECPECGQENEAYVPPTAGLEDITKPPEDMTAAAAAPAPAPAAAAKPKKEKKKKKAAAAVPGPGAAPAPAPAPAMPEPSMDETEMAELEGLEDVLTEEGEGEAECYKCGARVPLSVPKCPVCGADFE